MGLGGYINKKYYSEGRKYALKALAIDDSLIDPHLSLFYVQLFEEHDWEAARNSALTAIAIDGRSAEAHRALGLYYLTVGDLEKALYEHEVAVRYEPLDVILIRGIGWVSSFAGRHEKALEEYHRTLELDPSFRPSAESIGWLYAYRQDWMNAIKWFEQYQQMVGHPP